MPTASRNARKLRRAKLETRRTLKMLEFALSQRDQARMIAGALETHLKLKEAENTPKPDENPNVVFTKINNEEEEPSMTRKQTTEERAKFLDIRSKYQKDHEESVQAAQELAARDE
jgi:hypothetical protein